MIYLDNAATSRFKPRCMFDAMFSQLSNSSNSGRGGHNDSIDTAIKIYDTRNYLKKILGADEEYELIFTSNCTEALNLAILGYLQNFKNQPINVITSCNEHNSTLRPIYHLQSIQKIDIKIITPDIDGSINPMNINKSIDSNTKLICINHISNVTGAKSDIAQIGMFAQAKNVPLLIDSAQSLGHCDINIKDFNIDFLAAAGHKGLHASQGVGFLIYNKKFSLNPIKFGGTGTSSESVIQPKLPPEAFESGTLNAPAIIGLGASADWTYKNFEQISLNTRYLTTELLYGLRQNPNVIIYTHPSNINGVVSFNINGCTSTDVGDFLNENGIAVRCGLHCAPLIHKHLGTLEKGALRASIGYNNSINDIKFLLHTLEKFEI